MIVFGVGAVLALVGCGEDKDVAAPGVDGRAAGVSVDVYTATSDRDGYVEVPVDVAEGQVFQVVVEARAGLLSTDYAIAPSGRAAFDWEDWYESTESLTGALWPTTQQTSFDWPVRSEDGPLEEGTWTVKVATLNRDWEYDADVDVDVSVLVRDEPDAGAGTLHGVIAYAGGLEEDPEIVAGVEAAADWWIEIYGRIGITLEVEYTTIDLEADLGWADDGEDAVAALTDGEAAWSTLVVVGDTISGDDWLYGQAAAIPGAYTSTPRSVVYLSWVAHAGANGELTEGEVYQMGETMAHEVGHFLGLFHPVEDAGDQEWTWFDAVEDTQQCSSWERCEDALGTNLMFPYPVCYTRCERQVDLTEGQAAVANQWIGVE